MKLGRLFTVCLCLLFAAPHHLLAQTGPAQSGPAQTGSAETIDKTNPQQVLAYQGDAVLTQAAIDGAFSRIPETDRLMFVRDGAKVDQMIKSLLQAEVVAMDADKAGFSNDPVVRERVRLAARKELAEAWLDEQTQRMPEADYAAMAHEDYLAHPERYATEVKLDVSHILIGTDKRTPEEALALARELKTRLTADPALFDSLVEEYSDDPSKSSNKGKFINVRHGQMVKPFETAAYALKEPGQISDPVRSEFGYHLIRLDRRQESEAPPFEKVREQAEAQMKAKHASEYRLIFLQKLLKEPIVFPEGSIEIMARRYFGENLEKAPIFTEEGIQ